MFFSIIKDILASIVKKKDPTAEMTPVQKEQCVKMNLELATLPVYVDLVTLALIVMLR